MAVSAEKFEVSKAVIAPVTVDVVELHVQRLASPLRDSAPLATVLLEALLEQAGLQVAAAGCPSRHEQLVDSHRVWPRLDVAPLHRSPPRVPAEPEALDALRHRQLLL